MSSYSLGRLCAALFVVLGAVWPLHAQTIPYQFKAAAESPALEWFFLIADAGKEQGIWAKHGLQPEFVPAAGSAAQLKERVEGGIKLGFVSTAEAPLARAAGVPVKIVAAYLGETAGRIFVAAGGPIRTARELDRKKVGIVSPTHTSNRTVLYMNGKLGISAEPVPLGNWQNNVAALKAGRIDAFYSAEGAALTLVDAGETRLLLPLADIYPKPYTAIVVWATDDVIQSNRDLVARFVKATLEATEFIKSHPGYATEIYVRRTNAPRNVAEKAVAALNGLLTEAGRGSGQDLLAAVKGNWQFTVESGGVSQDTKVKIEDAVDVTFVQ